MGDRVGEAGTGVSVRVGLRDGDGGTGVAVLVGVGTNVMAGGDVETR